MSQYTHRITLVVPEQLMPQANQLALIVGESEHDDKTFTTAIWQDKDGNLYAVCSAVIKPIVLSLIDIPLAESPLQTKGADLSLAQQAMDSVVVYQESVTVTPDNIYVGIDIEPLTMFERLGLTIVENGYAY